MCRPMGPMVMRVAGMVALLVLVAGVGSAARAASPVAKSFGDLVREAELIVVGIVASTRSLELPEGAIVTDLTLDHVQALKTTVPTPAPLVIRVLGGRVGERELSVEGAPRLPEGRRCVLFVKGNGRDMLPFVGAQQGVFMIDADPRLGIQRVFDWRGFPVTGVVNDRVTVSPDGSAGDAMSLDEFARLIADALRG